MPTSFWPIKTKAELLAAYGSDEKQVQPYLEVNGFIGQHSNTEMNADRDGDSMSWEIREELRAGGPSLAVSILIHADTSREDGIRLVQKLQAKLPHLLGYLEDQKSGRDRLDDLFRGPRVDEN